MRRGKIIGAIVLVVAIGLIAVQQLREPDGSSAPANAAGGLGGVATGVPAVADGILPAAGQTRVYRVDPAQSEVYWRIYRSGAMARLGHNHVISIDEMSGRLSLSDDLAAAEWTLSFSVASLIIDDPEIRARYGEDFESVPSEDDKAGTKTNMLTEDLLDGASYPEIRLAGRGVFGSSLEAVELPVTIEIVGQAIEQRWPASLAIDSDAVTVTGEYRLTHADLGLTPFSLFGGAMAVGDEIDFTYRIRAVAGGQ
jgi:hypothetical protein